MGLGKCERYPYVAEFGGLTDGDNYAEWIGFHCQ